MPKACPQVASASISRLCRGAPQAACRLRPGLWYSPGRARHMVAPPAQLSRQELFDHMVRPPPNEFEPHPKMPAEAVAKPTARLTGRSLAMVLTLACSGILVVVPRPTQPQILPLPEFDNRETRRLELLERARAMRARDGRLSKDVRAVGEQLRRAGLMMFERQAVDNDLLNRLRSDVRALLELGKSEELRDLRALQAALFSEEVLRWQKTSANTDGLAGVSTEFRELGGTFATIAPDAWLDDHRRLLLSEGELKLLFLGHWGQLTGLTRHPDFAFTLEEMRRYYLTLLLYPPTSDQTLTGRALLQLTFAHALERIDPTYPSGLAVGILQIRLGRPGDAMASLQNFLEHSPSGPWSNIARNHLGLCQLQASAAFEF